MIVSIIKIMMSMFGSLLIADFITGIFHWLEDTYDIPFKSILCPNRLHHIIPREFVKYGFFDTISSSLYLSIPLLIISIVFKLNNLVLFTIIFGTFANQIHKFAHMSNNELAKYPFVRFVQRTGIFQSPNMHRKHHTNTLTNYCPMTNYVNWFLEYISLWRKLEYVIKFIFNIKPRSKRDLEVIKECNKI